MVKLPDDRGVGLVEWILFIILVLMILVTIYLLLRPAFTILLQDFLESLQ